jgi:hypothetical protein
MLLIYIRKLKKRGFLTERKNRLFFDPNSRLPFLGVKPVDLIDKKMASVKMIRRAFG